MSSSPEVYWQGSTFVVEWALTDLAGAPISGATLTGTVTLPGGLGDADMTVTAEGNVYTASWTATATAGVHRWRLEVTDPVDDAREGTFTVARPPAAVPAITVDPSTDIGRCRLLATDRDETAPLLTDADYSAFLGMEGGAVKRAAAAALETIATSEVLVSKKIRTQDLQTDGPAVAAELRARAKALRDQAAAEDDAVVAAEADFGFDFVDFDPHAAYREV